MNFFESQAKARSQTKKLLGLFALALLSLVVISNLLFMALFGYLQYDGQPITLAYLGSQFDWAMFASIGAVVIVFVSVASIYKTITLASGGKVVAQSLGGTLLEHSTDNMQYKIVLNVVEEMAIASGTPVPPVYVLAKESGINAFAAGFNVNDAVIGVTQGAIETFSRDELQGVIAHEFSHILNGDMRLNMRLIGILHGILLIGTLGYYIMRMSGISSRGKKGNQAIFVGLALVVLGYGGTFFGKIIKASISRQREFLADASAVQYTRNNVGIANALKKIGASSYGSTLETPEAQSVSHAFFSNALTNKFSDLFSTHPPLAKRIKELDPSWSGSFETVPTASQTRSHGNKQASNKQASNKQVHQPFAQSMSNHASIAGFSAANSAHANADLLANIGQVAPDHVELAKTYMLDMPDLLLNSVHTNIGAQAYVYALLLAQQSNDSSPQSSGLLARQQQYLSAHLPGDIFAHLEAILGTVQQLLPQHRLPLLEIALPQLRKISSIRYEYMLQQMQYLIFIDKTLSLFEWSVANIVAQYLKSEFETADSNKPSRQSAKQTHAQIQHVLSVVAKEFCSHNEYNRIISKAKETLLVSTFSLKAKDELSIEDFASAVSLLSQSSFAVKEKVLSLCVYAVMLNDVLSPQEHETLRALSECFGCPMPLIDYRNRAGSSS
jgi:Zn-dependent protease with chaperone function